MRGLQDNPEIIVIGAGAAGIGAGVALQRLGIPYVILEARKRTGGRAFTDTATLGHLWDHGCHWFHTADRNPLRRISELIGHGFHHMQRGATAPMFREGVWDMECTDRQKIWDMFDRVGAVKSDVPMADFIGSNEPLAPILKHWIELMTSGPWDQPSALDYARYDDSHINLPVRDGLGALIAKLAAGQPIRTGTPVTGIERTHAGVRISCDEGDLEAQAAIVTVSINVLRDALIEFTPALPEDFIAAIHNVPCGYYEKVAFGFKKWPFGDFSVPYCDIWDPQTDHPMNFEIGPFGRPIAIGHAAGSFARDIIKGGHEALIDFARQKLIAGFGSGISRFLKHATTTNWCADPYIRGGYAYAMAGEATARDALIAADLKPVFFAGEAFHPSWNATVHGAYMTGIEAAHAAAVRIGSNPLPADYHWLPAHLRNAEAG